MRQNNQSFFDKTVFHQKRGKKEHNSIPSVKQWNPGISTAHQIQPRDSRKTFLSCMHLLGTRLPCTHRNRFVPQEQSRDMQQHDKNEKDQQHNGHDYDSTGKQYQPTLCRGEFSLSGATNVQ